MPIFHPIAEKDVTRAIGGGFLRQFNEYAESDVIIVGGGITDPCLPRCTGLTHRLTGGDKNA